MTSTRIITSTPSVSGRAMVSADQATIIGNGTHLDPLRMAGDAAGGTTTFSADFFSPGFAKLGMPVAWTKPPFPAGAVSWIGAVQNSRLADGVVIDVNQDATVVRFQTDGLVVLPTEAWDEVTGSSGGLQYGVPYYVGTTLGSLTTTPPTTPGTSRVQVGIALNPTTLALTTPAREFINS